MEYNSPIVFVIGSGFTRAFDPNAPLLECPIDIDALLKKYSKFDGAKRVLEQVEVRGGLVNVERLMSRLYSGMPYDDDFLSDGERQILYSDIKELFLKLISKISCNPKKLQILENFAKYILINRASCLTFNYDDLLDQALFHSCIGKLIDPKTKKDVAWTPIGGYGFFIDSAHSLTGNPILSFTKSSSYLLKMHGSINWFPKRGYREPYPMNSIVHAQDWWPVKADYDDDIVHHYEHSPIIIPPVFDKSLLTSNTILRTIWSQAFEALSKAKTVIFIGYSFPDTDFAVINLFKESLFNKRDKDIYVVAKGSSVKKKESLKKRYKTILSQFSEKNFEFVDAAEWISRNCS